MQSLPLIPGIKRRMTRANDANSAAADAGLKAKRPGVLSRARFICAGCRYSARAAQHLDVHHIDDDHHNNDDANLASACHTCHPYQHIGELVKRTDVWGEGLGKKTVLATIPEVSASDMNLLQRAIGLALAAETSHPHEAAIAKEISDALFERADHTALAFGTHSPASFAAALSELDSDQYAARGEVIQDQRLLFSPAVLKQLGAEFAADYPSLPLPSWVAVAEGLPSVAG